MAGNRALQDTTLLGYTIRERIGAGGYGEVWRAEAPGGLEKAIKIVYGYHDEDRATRELKALARIKQVHHPFLISLERIEIIDGRLVIITELAEQSLKNRFDQCVAQGLSGVPRDELLVYLRDAADALDYMREQFSLQHLDVKPENLLLMGGRVKVADFGLVKQVQNNTSPSMLGGLTPAYAAPELFDDRPTVHSDQYSLAIVFHEMLCASLPFPGRTPAQLAAQHLHSRPNLERLPPHDRPVIARALAKSPEQRFPSCREMITALVTASRGGTTRPAAAPHPAVPARPTGATAPAGKPGTAELMETREAPSPQARSLRVQEIPVLHRDLAPVEVQPGDVAVRPTLWIAAGGTAIRVIAHLRRRLSRRWGSLEKLPAWETLCIDTDPQGLRDVLPDDATGLGPCLLTPLRKPQYYKDHPDRFSNWLSRRWLYNIPRSQRTEGLRPLGRLCFVDHAETLAQAVQVALGRITSPDALITTAATTGIQAVRSAPAVFVLASLAGASGGGMVLDLAYLVKSLLAPLGKDADLGCMLFHATERNAEAQDLAVANTTASIVELLDFTCGKGYPGAPECGLPPLDGDDARCLPTYLVHLGDNLAEQDWDGATARIAEYLAVSLTTPLGAYLEQCRRCDAQGSGSDSYGRTLAVAHVGIEQHDLPMAAASRIAAAILRGWLDRGRADSGERSVELAADSRTLMNGLGLTAARIQGALRQFAESALSSPLQSLLDHVIGVHLHNVGAIRQEQLASLVVAIDDRIGLREKPDDSDAFERERSPAELFKAGADQLRRELHPGLMQWITAFLDHPCGRWGLARQALEECTARMRALDEEIAKASEATRVALKEAISQLQSLAVPQDSGRRGPRSEGAKATPREALNNYFVVRVGEVLCSESARLAKALLGDLSQLSSQLVEFSRDIKHMLSMFGDATFPPPPLALSDGRSGGDPLAAIVARELHRRLPSLIAATDNEFQKEVLDPRGGLRALLAADPNARRALAELLAAKAQDVVFRSLRDFDLAGALIQDDSADPCGGDAGDKKNGARSGIDRCFVHTAALFAVSGSKNRWLLVAPSTESSERCRQILARLAEEEVTWIPSAGPDLLLCREVEQVSLQRILHLLTSDRPDYVEVAHRLHTRADISWLKLH